MIAELRQFQAALTRTSPAAQTGAVGTFSALHFSSRTTPGWQNPTLESAHLLRPIRLSLENRAASPVEETAAWFHCTLQPGVKASNFQNPWAQQNAMMETRAGTQTHAATSRSRRAPAPRSVTQRLDTCRSRPPPVPDGRCIGLGISELHAFRTDTSLIDGTGTITNGRNPDGFRPFTYLPFYFCFAFSLYQMTFRGRKRKESADRPDFSCLWFHQIQANL